MLFETDKTTDIVIGKLLGTYNADSYCDFLRKAIALADICAEHCNRKKEIRIIDPDGNIINIKLAG